MKTLEDLKADLRTRQAETRLKTAGMTDALWLGLLDRVVALPVRHAQVTRETKAEANRRRKNLADNMIALANDINEDWEVSEFYPRYGGAGGLQPVLRIGQPNEDALSLAGWLTEYADHLRAESPNDESFIYLESRHGTGLRSFVIRRVADLIEECLTIGRRRGLVTSKRAKNVETALLAGALLDQEVSANDVSQTRKKQRRKNDVE